MKPFGKQFCGETQMGWGTSPAHRGPSACCASAGTAARTSTPNRRAGFLQGFTLVELLVVIAIIAALASMVVGTASIAGRKIKESRVRTELNNLISAIENYKSRVGDYPPDNPANPQINPLFYELGGAVFTNNTFVTLGSSEVIQPSALATTFGVSGVANSARDPRDVPFTGFSPKPNQFMELAPPAVPANADVEVLVVPYPGPRMVNGKTKAGTPFLINPWFYDSSSTNRHNRQSFDLWAEILVGKRTNIIGNWKE